MKSRLLLNNIINIIKTTFLLLLLIGISIMPWLGYLEVPIMNEDFLILSWMNPQSFFDIFSNFFERVVGGPYWRPVVWTLDTGTKYFFGYSAAPYHISNILIYSSVCVLFYVFMRNIGFEKRRAWLGAFIFAVLPSHELSVAWIAGRTDTVMAMFLLLGANAFITGRKSKFILLPLLFFILAVLSKEPAFVIPVLPFLFLLIDGREMTKENVMKAGKYSALIFTVLLFVFLYRVIFIGGTPFESANFAHLSFSSFFENMLIYIPISFIRADQLEQLYYLLKGSQSYLMISSGISILMLGLFIIRYRKMEAYEKRLALFGVLWFIVFIIPACARFGQWYAFTASMGLIITLLSFVRINLKRVFYRYLFYFVIFLGLTSAVILSGRSDKWLYAGEVVQTSFQSIDYQSKGKDTLIFLAVPDKIDMVNTMKIGFSQGIWHYLKNDSLEVSSQLRLEMSKESFISYYKLDDDEILMEVYDGRFLPVGAGSRAVIIDEKFTYEDGFQSFEIETKGSPNIISQARIKIKEKSLINKTYIFIGKSFIPLQSLKKEEKSKKIYF